MEETGGGAGARGVSRVRTGMATEAEAVGVEVEEEKEGRSPEEARRKKRGFLRTGNCAVTIWSPLLPRGGSVPDKTSPTLKFKEKASLLDFCQRRRRHDE